MYMLDKTGLRRIFELLRAKIPGIATDGTPGLVKSGGDVTVGKDGSMAAPGKADKPVRATATLAAASWTGVAAPYSCVVPMGSAYRGAESDVTVIPQAKTEEGADAWQNLGYMVGTQYADSLSIEAWGERPGVDLPVELVIRN